MEQYCIWDKPFVFLADDGDELIQAFGLVLTGIDYTITNLADYVKYILAALKWDEDGNSMDKDEWVSKEGITYNTFDSEIQVLMNKAYEETPVYASVFETDLDFGKEWRPAEFITDADIARDICENGRLVDVVFTRDMGSGQGGFREERN